MLRPLVMGMPQRLQQPVERPQVLLPGGRFQGFFDAVVAGNDERVDSPHALGPQSARGAVAGEPRAPSRQPVLQRLRFPEQGAERRVVTGSGIRQLADIRGKKIAFTSETSNSGFKAASLLLRDKVDMTAGRDYQPVFSGKHDNSILGVANGHYPVAAIADFVRLGMERRGLVKPGQTVVLYTSESFPTIAYGHAHNLTPELAAKVRQAFFSFDWRGSALAGEFGRSDPPLEKFLTVSYRDTWRIVREIDQAMGVSHACR